MGKKKQKSGLGKAIIKDRFGSQNRRQPDSFLHTSELNDGYDWGRLNLQSVTEQSTLEDFLATAELAGTEFQAEKLNVTLVNPEKHTGLLTWEEELRVRETQDQHRQLLSVPRRPMWDETTTKEELELRERDSFLEWRRKLAQLQDVEGLVLTPFERNLDFWRQLWRVLERSDVVVQILDGRNPLLFYCEDVDTYVQEIDENKVTMLLINKADYLTQEQRQYWAEYFSRKGRRAVFWSATEETERNKERDAAEAEDEVDGMDDCLDDSDEWTDDDQDEDTDDEDDDEKTDTPEKDKDVEDVELDDSDEWTDDEQEVEKSDTPEKDKDVDDVKNRLGEAHLDVECSNADSKTEGPSSSNAQSSTDTSNTCDANPSMDTVEGDTGQGGRRVDTRGVEGEGGRRVENSSDMVTGDELVEVMKSLYHGQTYQEGVVTVGLVGYPNVGKSSTINALLQTKKVPVSATPGRTKHFQTLYLTSELVLCDCPGLVMPTFVSTKAEMVVSGILPIDQMREYVPPVSLVCRDIPRPLLELTYGLLLPKPREEDGEDPDRPPTAHELLAAYACMRGYMTHKGIPDYQRAARLVLKDYVNGKLLYCHPPPCVTAEDFRPTPDLPKVMKVRSQPAVTQPKGTKAVSYTSAMDKEFFAKEESKFGSKGVAGCVGYTRTDGLTHQMAQQMKKEDKKQTTKPWKKHNNKCKKEKLRRLNRHLDVHD